jgi:integrase
VASIQKKGESYYCQFCYLGKRHTVTIGAVSRQEADAYAGRVDQLLLRIKQRLLCVPPGVAITEFILADGQVKTPEIEAAQTGAPPQLTFAQFRDKYLEARSGGSLEANSLATIAMHLRHVARTLGERFAVRELTLADLQRHVNNRAAVRFRGRPLSAYTLRKEVGTFRTAWNWGSLHGLVSGGFPSRGLLYPKLDEKPPFLTWEELERETKDLPRTERLAAWERLYLRKQEIEQLLAHVKDRAAHPWIYPMFCTAAYTGMRRSELLRAEVADVKLETGLLLVREKKRSRQKRTTRHVSLSPFLKMVLTEWLSIHPGCKYLFCWSGVVTRSPRQVIG